MSGEMEAAGGLATAGLVAGAIEGPEPGKAGEGECLNCSTPLNGGRFCSNCGQHAHANRSLWALIEELAWNVFNLDTKAWRTVPRLIARPGTLTRSYIDGKRARYLTPLATFLLCYFFMFLVFSAVPKPSTLDLRDSTSAAEHVSDARDNLKDAQEGLQEAQQRMADAREAAAGNPARQAVLQAAERGLAAAQAGVQRRQAALARAEQQQREAAHAPVQVHTHSDTSDSSQPNTSVAQTPVVQAPAVPIAPGATTVASPAPPTPPPTFGTSVDGNPDTLDDLLREISRQNFNIDGRPALSAAARSQLANPPLFYSHLQESASRWGFLLVPISLPFIAFLFLFKKNITLYDHTVFALNSLSFASLLFALMLGTTQVSWLHWVPGIGLGIVLPVHTFFHIGGAYKMKWWSALWRTFFMLFFAVFVLLIFFFAVLFIGLSG